MKVALAQLNPEADLELDCDTACSVIGSRRDADLILFPELFLGGYSTGDPGSVATSPEGPEIQAIGEACAGSGSAAIVGFTERLEGEGFANSAALLTGDGALAGIYRKTNLFGAGEKAAYRQGDSLLVAPLAGWSVGTQICFDVEFPEPSRLMSLAGAGILATISSNMEPYAADHRLAARARALDNRLPHLYVNRVGSESGHVFTGESCVIASDGSVIAGLDRQEDILECEIESGSAGTETSYLELLRTDLEVIVQENANGGEA